MATPNVVLNEDPSLFHLIRRGSMEAVKWYLEHFEFPVLPRSKTYTALEIAIQECFEMATAWQDETDNQALEDRLQILCMVASRTDLKAQNSDGCTVFHNLVHAESPNSNVEMICCAILECLFDSCSSVPTGQQSEVFSITNHDGHTALHASMLAQNFHAAISLLQKMQGDYEQFSLQRTIVDDENKDIQDSVPLLELAIQTGSSRCLLRQLLSRFPESARIPFRGKLPLVTALEFGLPVRKVKKIVEFHPKAVQIPTGDGDLPLHLACLYYREEEMLEYLIELYPEALETSNCHGQLPLHCLVECDQETPLETSFVELLCRDDSKSTLSHADSFGELPLHAACRKIYSMEVDTIRYLIEQFPDAILTKSRYGHLPLHLAAASLGGVEVSAEQEVTRVLDILQLLIAYCPDCLWWPDHEGDLPLHCLVQNNNVSPLLLREFLVSPPHPRACLNAQNGQLPLHTACSNHTNLEVLEELISYDADALHHYDQEGYMPVHHAIASRYAFSTIERLAFHESSSSSHRDQVTLPSTAHSLPALFVACRPPNCQEDEDEDSRDTNDVVGLDNLRLLLERSPELFEGHQPS